MKGFTLFELLIAMAISGILLGLAVPGFGAFMERTKSQVSVAELFTALLFTRNYAVSHGKNVHICGSDDGVTCKQRWSKQLIAFIDENDNQQAEPAEIIRHFQLDLDSASMRTRIAFGKPYTIFKPNGQASYTGSVIYCPKNREPRNLHRVTWNRIGRAYKGIDKNRDGVIDDTNGRSLVGACP